MEKVKINDDYYYDVIRFNIKKYRKEKGITQAELAELSDLSVDYIREIESFKRRKSFSIAALTRIAVALDIDITSFFKENDA